MKNKVMPIEGESFEHFVARMKSRKSGRNRKTHSLSDFYDPKSEILPYKTWKGILLEIFKSIKNEIAKGHSVCLPYIGIITFVETECKVRIKKNKNGEEYVSNHMQKDFDKYFKNVYNNANGNREDCETPLKEGKTVCFFLKHKKLPRAFFTVQKNLLKELKNNLYGLNLKFYDGRTN